MRQFATYFPATQRQNLPDKTSRFGKTSFPSPLQSVAERLLISFAPLNCCYHIINKLSLCQPIYRTKVHFLKIVQTTHTFSRFIDYQLFTPYIKYNYCNLSFDGKNPTVPSVFFGGEREVSCCFATNISSAPRDSCHKARSYALRAVAFYIRNEIQAFFANIKKAILRIRKIAFDGGALATQIE